MGIHKFNVITYINTPSAGKEEVYSFFTEEFDHDWSIRGGSGVRGIRVIHINNE